MSYIGSTPTSQNFISGTDYFNGTGSQTAFTLARTVNSVNDIEVIVNNVIQQPNSYTISGTTLTLSAAPSTGTGNIYVRYLSTNLQSFTVPSNSIDSSKLAVLSTIPTAAGNLTIPQKTGTLRVTGDTAFYGFRNGGNVTGSATVAHNAVITSIGNNYNSTTGIFTCPVAGVYEVMVGGHAENSQPIAMQIRQNGTVKAEEYSNGSAFGSATAFAILSCAANDTITHVVSTGTCWGGNESGLRMSIKLIG
jgi:hypothetical protein